LWPAWVLVAATILAALPAHARDWSVKVVDKDPPAAIADSIKAELQHKAVQVSDSGKLAFEFWLVKDLPLKSKPASPDKALDNIAEITLLGAAVVHQDERDFRDDDIFADTYTMRFGLQPQDGDHLGTSIYPYFALLTMAKLDKSAKGFSKFKDLEDASETDTPSEHPVVMSLRPPSKKDGTAPEIRQPDTDKTSVYITVPATADGEKMTLPFEIVVEGHGVL